MPNFHDLGNRASRPSLQRYIICVTAQDYALPTDDGTSSRAIVRDVILELADDLQNLSDAQVASNGHQWWTNQAPDSN